MIRFRPRRADPPPSRRQARQEEQGLAAAMCGNMRAFLLFAIAYFVVNTLFYRVAGDPGWLPALSGATLIACGLFWVWNRRAASMTRLEITSHVLGFLFIANALLDICLAYQPVKLLFLLLLLPAFSISGARLRAALPSSLAAVAAFVWAAWRFERAHFGDYLWVAFAGVIIGAGLAGVIRMSMREAVRARTRADAHRDEALSLAAFDALTGLANRRAFLNVAEQRLSEGGRFYLGLVDLDGFKPINDIFGHAAGDRVLVEVARRLREVCGPEAVVARLGGDEFALILPDPPGGEAWRARADRISEHLARPYALDAETAHLSASLGFALHDENQPAAAPSKLLERADYALYEAKEKGRGVAVLFEPHHEALIRNAKAVEQALRGIDSEKELTLAFQPQRDVRGERTLAFEALARWRNARLGQVPPDVFIRAAERSGLITGLTPVLLKKALKAARRWPGDLRLAFNLSARDILSPAAVAKIAQVVRESGVDARRIEFEITETAMLTDFDRARANIAALRALGCRMALDDFGSGYSNFSYLNRVEVDTVKIDRSFVQALGRGEKAREIIKSMIELAQNLGMDHVIEGVETEAEMHQLRLAGARQVQGFLYGRPMDEADIAAFLRAEHDARLTG
ncbi:MAG TPA: EAL domain-containing protein [Asticcacaulis sp.]